jgi:predicted alpha/beta-fold hydrolase
MTLPMYSAGGQHKLAGLEFTPHRLARNRHFQTIYSSIRRASNNSVHLPNRSITLVTDDHVRLAGYYTPHASQPSRGLVLFLHGWLGSANAPYILALAAHLLQRGYSVFRLNLRDHGNTHDLNPGIFRSDRLEEVFEATRQVAHLEPDQPLHIIGLSLGGSFALRVAWRHSQNPIPNMGQTVAICPLMDPYHSTVVLDQAPVYLTYFRRSWRQAFLQKQAAFPDRYDFSPELAAHTCMEMTEAFMHHNGPYPDALTYFEAYRVSPAMMAGLTSPVTILTAADDPVIPVEDFDPFHNLSPHLTLSIQRYGGHVGFIDLFPFRYWMNEAIVKILAKWKEDSGRW